MKLLVWIKKQQRGRDRLKGFLLFLLLLLVIHYALMENKADRKVKIGKASDEYFLKTDELTAYHKITLGMPVNINTESAEGLTALPGIGKTLARTIERERIKRNGFKNISELRGLPGIGEKKFSKIAPHVRL
jgi:competence ComEA-like helix-hairpin-helix protein